MFASAAKGQALNFEELKAESNGPFKKFYLIKNFRAEILSQTDQNPSHLGCDALVALIEKARS